MSDPDTQALIEQAREQARMWLIRLLAPGGTAIFVIEDDATLLRALAARLEEAERGNSAQDFDEALAAYRAGAPK